MRFIKYYEAIEKDFEATIYTTPNTLIIETPKKKHTVLFKDLGTLKRYNINFYKYFLDLLNNKHINAFRYVKKEKYFNSFLKAYIESEIKGFEYLEKVKGFEKSTLLQELKKLQVLYNSLTIKQNETTHKNIYQELVDMLKQFLNSYFNLDLETFGRLLDIERKDLK